MVWILLLPVLPYLIFLIWIFRNLISIKPFSPGHIADIRLSVVIACKNEEKNLPLLLGDLSLQDYPPELYEVIIVDDSSTDSTFEVATVYSKIKGLKVIPNDGKGKKSAIRTGIEAAANEFIVTTDADCRAGRGWIRTTAVFYSEKKPDMIIGPVRLISLKGFFSRFQELEFLGLQGITAGTAAAGDPVLCNGANLSFTKQAYYKHFENLRDEIASGDDIFFLQSLKKSPNAKIMWLSANEALITTSPMESPGSFLCQRARWISKVRAYKDLTANMLAISTFIIILGMMFPLAAGIFKPSLLFYYLFLFLIKSVPDLLVLWETTRRYGKGSLLKWYIPSQVVYPFYMAAAVVYAVVGKANWK